MWRGLNWISLDWYSVGNVISKCLTCRTIGRFVEFGLYDIQSKANIVYFVIGWSIDVVTQIVAEVTEFDSLNISFRSISVCDLFGQRITDNDIRDKRTNKLTMDLSTKTSFSTCVISDLSIIDWKIHLWRHLTGNQPFGGQNDIQTPLPTYFSKVDASQTLVIVFGWQALEPTESLGLKWTILLWFRCSDSHNSACHLLTKTFWRKICFITKWKKLVKMCHY